VAGGSVTRDAEDDRERLRARLVAAIPRWYSPWLHLAFPSLVGLGIVAASIAACRGVRPLEWLTVPIVWLVSNAFEWRVHRDVLHRRTPGLRVLYDRHTPEHHRVFVTDDMAMREAREFRLVLIPAYGIVVIALVDVPIALGLAALGLRNVGALALATSIGYTVAYEWLHLAYHLPSEHPISRLGVVRALRRHHAIHHAPELMQRWNFNVTVPLWDWVRGTVWREEDG
jgi:hypothetical protein